VNRALFELLLFLSACNAPALDNGTPKGTWTVSPARTTQSLLGLWGRSASDVWAVGEGGTILHWSGSDWQDSPSGTTYPLRGVWGTATNDVWAVGDPDNTRHWDGRAWTPVLLGTPDYQNAVWAYRTDDVWVAAGSMYHWNGLHWMPYPTRGNPWAIRGTDASNAWAVGEANTALHWDGNGWTHVAMPIAAQVDLSGISIISDADIWVVGGVAGLQGTTVHWDGTTWERVTSGTETKLYDVWSATTNDVWAVGQGGTVLHWDGQGWSLVQAPVTVKLWAIWGSGPGEFWIAGDQGTLVRYQASSQ
jgi:hypothetical protein